MSANQWRTKFSADVGQLKARIEELEVEVERWKTLSATTYRWLEAKTKGLATAEREAAFWKWLWEYTNTFNPAWREKSEETWLVHMRERFERETL